MKVRHFFPAVTFLLLAVASSARPAHAEGAATAQARRLFEEAQKQFDLGNWDAAIQGFSKAYEVRPDPSFLYNMAQAYRRGGNPKRAIDLYKNYLIRDPKSSQRAEVEERIRALQKQVEEEEAKRGPPQPGQGPAPDAEAPEASTPPAPSPSPALAPSPLTPASETSPGVTTQAASAAGTIPSASLGAAGSQTGTPPPPRDATSATPPTARLPDTATHARPVADAMSRAAPSGGSRALRTVGIVLGGAGVAAAVAGAFFTYRTHSLSTSVSNAPRFNDGDALAGKRAELAQWICYGSGLALASTGAVLYWRGRSKKAAQVAVGLAPWWAESGGGLVALGHFR